MLYSTIGSNLGLAMTYFDIRFPICAAILLFNVSASGETAFVEQNSDSIADAVSSIRAKVGDDNVQEFLDGGLVIALTGEVPTRHSKVQTELAEYLQDSCAIEIGHAVRNEAGKIVPLRGSAVTPAPSRSTSATFVTSFGYEYELEVRSLMDTLLRRMNLFRATEDESRFVLQLQPYLSFRDEAWARYAGEFNCYGPSNAEEGTEPGLEPKLLVSESYVERRNLTYAVVILTESLLRQVAEEFAIPTFRSNLAIGDETQCGYVVGIREPMVEIAADVGSRWLHSKDLVPKGTPKAGCPE